MGSLGDEEFMRWRVGEMRSLGDVSSGDGEFRRWGAQEMRIL